MAGALYPGSFDPFTNGHLDVVERSLDIFGGVVVAVAANPAKRAPLFTPEERVEMIRDSLGGQRAVEVTTYTGLTVDYARERGIRVLVKGLRTEGDFDPELQQSLMNRSIAPDVHTVFLMASVTHLFVSSSILKDIASHGRDIGDFVPPEIARRVKERFS
jgi:pantetheine-phosphate adenylyltransferase